MRIPINIEKILKKNKEIKVKNDVIKYKAGVPKDFYFFHPIFLLYI
jgi:hypothetical protein